MKDLLTSILMILVMTLGLGIIYPLAVWGVAQVAFPYKANGSLIEHDGKVVGSELIGQTFTSPGYFHSRPSAAGNGYDAAASGGSNLGPTSKKLIDRVATDAEALAAGSLSSPVPADLVTTSASGLDPHISPFAAEFQIARVARERNMNQDEVRKLVQKFSSGRQLGVLGEPRVSVLPLNLALDDTKPLTGTKPISTTIDP